MKFATLALTLTVVFSSSAQADPCIITNDGDSCVVDLSKDRIQAHVHNSGLYKCGLQLVFNDARDIAQAVRSEFVAEWTDMRFESVRKNLDVVYFLRTLVGTDGGELPILFVTSVQMRTRSGESIGALIERVTGRAPSQVTVCGLMCSPKS